MKNKAINEWCRNETKIYDNIQKTIDRLMPLLKQELLKYPEIEFEDYQRNKYYPKVLIIKLKEGDN